MKTKAPAQVSLITTKPPNDRFAHLSQEERASIKELAAVERAIAALEGRTDASPEDVAFARKEAERMRQSLAATLGNTEQHLRELRRARVRRAVAGVVSLGVAAGLAAIGVPIARARLAAREAASQAAARAAAPFAAEGFAEIGTATGLEARVFNGERGLCLVAVAGAADGTANVRISRGLASVQGPSAGACACGAEPIRIQAEGREPIELRVLAAPASAVGGADLLSLLPAPPAAQIAEVVDRACAEEATDSYLAAHVGLARRAPVGALEPKVSSPSVEPAALAAPSAAEPEPADALEPARVRRLGLELAAVAPPSHPLVAIPPTKDACFLAVSDVDGDALSLRVRGGARPVSRHVGPIALCGSEVAGASLWREGRGVVRVYAATAERVGGLLGMRELAARLGWAPAFWVAPGDLAFDARAALLASGLAPREPSPKANAELSSIVAVSSDERSLLAVDARATDVVCSPPLVVGAVRSMCLETRRGALVDPERLPAGVALSPRPLWLPVVKGQRAELERMLEVLAFARRLSAAGFELTTLTGFVEVPGGVEITGRSREKEIVAITLSSLPPYVHPLTDGAGWKLDGDPRVVPLAAGDTVKLAPVPPYVGAKSGRETIVWRR